MIDIDAAVATAAADVDAPTMPDVDAPAIATTATAGEGDPPCAVAEADKGPPAEAADADTTAAANKGPPAEAAEADTAAAADAGPPAEAAAAADTAAAADAGPPAEAAEADTAAVADNGPPAEAVAADTAAAAAFSSPAEADTAAAAGDKGPLAEPAMADSGVATAGEGPVAEPAGSASSSAAAASSAASSSAAAASSGASSSAAARATGRGKAKGPKWLPLESNPEIFNHFMTRIGVEPGWKYVDVWSIALDCLDLVPKPVMAVCMLYPYQTVHKPRRADLRARESVPEAPPATFYLVQNQEFGNACGTIAAMHTVGNLARAGVLSLTPGSPAETFLQEAADMLPEEAGLALARSAPLQEVSDRVARSRRAQTRTPARDVHLDGHFTVFVPIDGHLVELDGAMRQSICHGSISEAGFFQDVARLIQGEFMDRAPGNVNFTVMALVPEGAPPAGEDVWNVAAVAGGHGGGVDIDETKLLQLAGMGFDIDQARDALVATGGDADAAVGLLLCGV